jgi:membrane fusion protein, copper/silver efflux system
MTSLDRIRAMPRTSKRLWALGLAIVVAIGATWAVMTLVDGEGAPRGQARPAGGAGMEGMSGMDMGGMAMGGEGSVQLSAEQIRTFGVTVGTVELRTLSDEVRTVGIVNFDETRLAGVTPKFDGYVERLYVNFTGQPVRRGQPLAEIYSPELVAAQEELLLAARLEADLSRTVVPGVPRGSSDLLAAARQRLRLWDISEEQIERILTSGSAERTLTLHAPVGGIVVEKNVIAGAAVQAGQTLYTIADLSEVWVEAELREADAGLIEEGSAVTIDLAAFPGRPLQGRVEYVYPTLANEARTLKARIAVANPAGRIKPGMYATVRLNATGRSALTVPTSAVLNTGERRIVFVDMGEGRLMPHDVEIGRIAGGFAEVLAGLEPGQRVVTSAQYLLDSESNLAEVMKSMMGMTGSSEMEGMDMPVGEGGMDAPGADMKGMEMPGKER